MTNNTSKKPILINSNDDRQRLLTQIQQLKASAGWKLFLNMFESRQVDKTNDILNDEGQDAEKKYTEGDLNRRELKVLKECVNFPDVMIATLKNQTTNTVPELDPY